MSDIHLSYPEYASTAHLDLLRATQYSYLDEQNHVYLDYTGAGLAAREQYRVHKSRLDGATFGNPHSENPTSRFATDLVERARRRVLAFLNASHKDYQVIFTPNATGAAKLVGESYPFDKRSRLVLTYDNHNSLNGLREYARRRGARTVYVPMNADDLRISTDAVTASLRRSKRWRLRPSSSSSPSSVQKKEEEKNEGKKETKKTKTKKKRGLFVYPAQSNFSGVRHPLSWIDIAQDLGYDVLLDAAAYLPTCELDLSIVRPEFVMVSWYKVFGFPTGVGCLIARHDALERLERPYFSGGTVQAATVGVPWHSLMPNEGAFEDGTVNFLSIPDVHFGLDWISSIGLDSIGIRVRCLTAWLIDQLLELTHSNGREMVTVYGPTTTKCRGGTVAFNLVDVNGNIIDERLVAAESSAARISLRTGCFCNPGAGETTFGIGETALKRLLKAQTRNYDDFFQMVNLQSGGAIRVSFGIASTVKDVNYFIAFVVKTYTDRACTTDGLAPRTAC